MTQSCEVSWFSALCDDDYEFLGQPDPRLASSWEHCRNIVMQAEKGGFDNILLPSGYALGMDTTAFAAAIAAITSRIRLLMAVRIGESWPPQLARQIATLDQISGGRMTINIISSDLPGETMESNPRYARTVEAMQILKTLLNGEHLSHKGDHWNIEVDPPRIKTVSGTCPPLYFGGLSPAARDAAARACDVFLMWPDKMETVRAIIADMTARAAAYGRTLKFGYRAHVVVRARWIPEGVNCCRSRERTFEQATAAEATNVGKSPANEKVRSVRGQSENSPVIGLKAQVPVEVCESSASCVHLDQQVQIADAPEGGELSANE